MVWLPLNNAFHLASLDECGEQRSGRLALAPSTGFYFPFPWVVEKKKRIKKRKTGYRINQANSSFWRRQVNGDAKLSSIARRGPETAVVGSAASDDTAEKASDWLAVWPL